MTDIREWANANGYTIGPKGRIPATIQQAYDAAHQSGNGSTASTGPDYPHEDFDAAFPAPESDYTGPEDAGASDDTGETKPRRPRGKQRASRPSWLPGSGAKKKPGRKQPRVSTEELLGSVCRGAAKLASPLPPLQRTLRLQAPVAGLLLEDAVKGTAVDTVLQPLARIANQGKTVQALVGPPAFVTAIMVHQIQRANLTPPQEPHPMFMALATEGLRSSLMAWMDIAGPKFDVAMQREREFEEKYGQSVDDTIALIFSAPVNPNDVEAVMAEEEAIKRAQGVL
jgi:hypothetical protein